MKGANTRAESYCKGYGNDKAGWIRRAGSQVPPVLERRRRMPGVQTITPKFGRHKVSKDAADAFRKNNGAAARAANAIKPDAQPDYLLDTE